jgi:hypothetical protein
MTSFEGFFVFRTYQIIQLLAYKMRVIRESFQVCLRTPELARNELTYSLFSD